MQQTEDGYGHVKKKNIANFEPKKILTRGLFYGSVGLGQTNLFLFMALVIMTKSKYKKGHNFVKFDLDAMILVASQPCFHKQNNLKV